MGVESVFALVRSRRAGRLTDGLAVQSRACVGAVMLHGIMCSWGIESRCFPVILPIHSLREIIVYTSCGFSFPHINEFIKNHGVVYLCKYGPCESLAVSLRLTQSK